MKYKLCKCVYCGESLDRNTEEWETTPNHRYAHKKCFDQKMQEKKEKQEIAQYKIKIHEKVQEVCGVSYVKTRTEKQIKQYLLEGKTAEGIYKTLEYWYDIKHGDPAEAHGGIGIVPYIYEEAIQYWNKQEHMKQTGMSIPQEQINQYVNSYNGLPRKCPPRAKVTKPLRTIYFILD